MLILVTSIPGTDRAQIEPYSIQLVFERASVVVVMHFSSLDAEVASKSAEELPIGRATQGSNIVKLIKSTSLS